MALPSCFVERVDLLLDLLLQSEGFHTGTIERKSIKRAEAHTLLPPVEAEAEQPRAGHSIGAVRPRFAWRDLQTQAVAEVDQLGLGSTVVEEAGKRCLAIGLG